MEENEEKPVYKEHFVNTTVSLTSQQTQWLNEVWRSPKLHCANKSHAMRIIFMAGLKALETDFNLGILEPERPTPVVTEEN